MEPLEHLDEILTRLRASTAESRVLEWKATGLFGHHVPPSAFIPHVTTKDITEIDAGGARKTILARYTVYYRQGAKSEPATPVQHQKIVEKRTIRLRDELVRRVKEVSVPVLVPGRAGAVLAGTAGTVARLTNDPSAPAVRVTRAPSQATGVLLHEELSDGLFEEINNVLDANHLLAGGTERFLFGEEIYYRVYAERHHVNLTGSQTLLFRTALRELYGPYLFWLTTVPHVSVAKEILEAIEAPKHPMILGAFRAIVLLGEDATSWLNAVLDKKHKSLSQPPEYYWAFKRMVGRTNVTDRRLIAMRTTANALRRTPRLSRPQDGGVVGCARGGRVTTVPRLCARVSRRHEAPKPRAPA